MDLDCIYEEYGFQEHNPMLVSRSISEIFISNVNLFYFFKFNLGMQRASSDNSCDKKKKKQVFRHLGVDFLRPKFYHHAWREK